MGRVRFIAWVGVSRQSQLCSISEELGAWFFAFVAFLRMMFSFISLPSIHLPLETKECLCVRMWCFLFCPQKKKKRDHYRALHGCAQTDLLLAIIIIYMTV